MIKTIFFTDLPAEQAQCITACAPAHFRIETHPTSLADSDKVELLRDAHFLILFPGRLADDVLASAPHLRLIQLVSAGFDQMNLSLCKQLGVPVANNGGTNAIDVAEHTLALTLGLYRRLVDLDRTVRAGQWSAVSLGSETRTVYGKTLGIVGLGHIGRRVAQLFAALGAHLAYSDPVAADPETERALGIGRLPLDHLLSCADIVSLHVPLLPNTRHLIGAAQLAHMKKDALLINTCRGPVVDQQALSNALREGRIAGAGIDVFEAEPIVAGDPLLAHPNALYTPHAAGVTRDTWGRRGAFVFDNLQRVWDGLPPRAQL